MFSLVGQTDGGQMDEWMDGWMYGWLYGRIEKPTLLKTFDS